MEDVRVINKRKGKVGTWGGTHRPGYLYGEAVRHHHDDQWDEEGHEGANQHEALLVEDTAAVDEDLVLVVEADHRDGHRYTYKEIQREDGSEEINVSYCFTAS